jgi:argininosuccinate synthase
MSEKVILAFSGGLDTSVCVKLLEEKFSHIKTLILKQLDSSTKLVFVANLKGL